MFFNLFLNVFCLVFLCLLTYLKWSVSLWMWSADTDDQQRLSRVACWSDINVSQQQSSSVRTYNMQTDYNWYCIEPQISPCLQYTTCTTLHTVIEIIILIFSTKLTVSSTDYQHLTAFTPDYLNWPVANVWAVNGTLIQRLAINS